jgi:hypothetical protein
LITHDTLHEALGKSYAPAENEYVVAERGPQVSSKITQGWRIAGEIDNRYASHGANLLILAKPRKTQPTSRLKKLGGILKRTNRG